MCFQDWQLAKGLTRQPPQQASVSTNKMLVADARRMRLLVSCFGEYGQDPASGTFQLDRAFLFAGPDQSGVAAFAINPVTGPFVLRVEDIGELVWGEWSVNIANPSGTFILWLQPIIYIGDIPPLARGPK